MRISFYMHIYIFFSHFGLFVLLLHTKLDAININRLDLNVAKESENCWLHAK